MKTVRVCLLIVMLTLVGKSVWAFECITVFGDSLSDTGNASLANYSDGLDFPPIPPYYGGPDPDLPAGRFSNGKVWVEHFTDALFSQNDPDHPVVPNLLLGSILNNTSISGTPYSLNYAWAGAVTGSESAIFLSTLDPNLVIQGGLPLDAQISIFLDDFNSQQSATDSAYVCGLDPTNSLFIVWVGSNDILLLNENNLAKSVKNIQYNIERLIDTGVIQFLIANMPDVTVTPAYRTPDLPSFFIANDVIYVSQDKIRRRVLKFNEELGEALGKIEERNPGVNISLFDAFSIFDQLIKNPDEFSLTNTSEPCLDELETDPSCGTPQEYLFWDGVHPTTKAHEILALEALAALSAE